MNFVRTAHDVAFRALARLPVRPRIRIMSGGCGFFSDVFMSFNGIQACREYKMSGEIFWGRRSLYFDKHRGGNAHTHYFQNSQLAGMTVLGVHVRGTDALAGFEQCRTQSAEAFLAESENWLVGRSDGVIFLATDDEDVLALFKARIGNRVHFTNSMRSKTGASIHGHLDAGTAGNPYAKGREALIDALLLSRCAFLIRGFSYLTAYSLCYNPDLRFLDVDRQNLGVMRTPWLHR